MKLRKRGYVGTTSTEMSQREKDNAILAREAAAEGFVLLKNEAQTLPLKPGTKIGLYGAGAVRTPQRWNWFPEMSITDIMSIFMTD